LKVSVVIGLRKRELGLAAPDRFPEASLIRAARERGVVEFWKRPASRGSQPRRLL
jgi:hypothetical protein